MTVLVVPGAVKVLHSSARPAIVDWLVNVNITKLGHGLLPEDSHAGPQIRQPW